MRRRGELVRDTQGRWGVGDALHWERMPARVETVIGERMGGLPNALQEALRVGSVEGKTFTAEVVAQVLGVEPLGLVRALSGLVGARHGLIAPAGVGPAPVQLSLSAHPDPV